MAGQLARSPFRSVCWKLFLGALDRQSKTWAASTSQSRARCAPAPAVGRLT